MSKLLQSRKFVYGVLSLVSMVLVTLVPQTQKYVEVLIPAIVIVYGLLAFGTTSEDSIKAWTASRPTTAAQSIDDILAALREMTAAAPVVKTETFTATGDAPPNLLAEAKG